ncbi:PQQ-binding-like beta-propeller repeat protein [Paraglaciecola sp. 2405UD69-4]|uniref:Calx-beta domain-containing protein n=1 Tax=Paraglaciecola sp. 2405UD69-4 TaxID=3391836 RepID=UPI0039C99239
MVGNKYIVKLLGLTVFSSSSLFATDGDLKWTFETGAEIISSPTFSNSGVIYIGSYDHKLYAINQDGSLAWSFSAGAGISATPVIADDGTIYFGSIDNNIYALNSDGTLKWSFTTDGDINSWASIGQDETVYIGSDDNKVYALNNDGTLKWSYETNGDVRSSPTVSADGVIYFGSYDNNFYALNSDGTLKWSYETGAEIAGSSAIGDDGTIYTGSFDGNIYAFQPDGTVSWTFTTENRVRSSPAIDINGNLYFGSYDTYLYSISSDGELNWRYPVDSVIQGSPTITSDGTVYIGASNGVFYAVSSDGELNNSYTTAGAIFSSAAVGTDGTLYAGSFDGKLYAFEGSYGLMQSVWPRFGQNSTGSSLVGDNDPVPSQLQFSTSALLVNEGTTTADIELIRTNGAVGDVSVDIISKDSSAESPNDYLSIDSTITLLNGETSSVVSVTIINDSDVEDDESFTLSLANLTGDVTFGVNTVSTITIIDDGDTLPTGTFNFVSANYTVDEGDGSVNIPINRINGSYGEASTDYLLIFDSASSEDVTELRGTVIFADGETSKTLTIPIVDDSTSESLETFSIELNNVSGAVLGEVISTTVSIIDNDEPVILPSGTLNFDSTNYSVNEGDENLVLTITRTNGSNGEVSVDYVSKIDSATTDDYTDLQGTLVFADGETNKTLTISIIDDDFAEDIETFSVELSNASGAILGEIISTTVTITDNDSTTSTPEVCSACKKAAGSLNYTIILLLGSIFLLNTFLKPRQKHFDFDN